jgi:hypothetical protein
MDIAAFESRVSNNRFVTLVCAFGCNKVVEYDINNAIFFIFK